MSEEKTAEINGSASFEERVFARFDAIDRQSVSMQEQFADMRERVERLETKSYDTKPIWEQALAGIRELKQELRDINQKPRILNDEMLQRRAEQRDFDARIADLASPRR